MPALTSRKSTTSKSGGAPALTSQATSGEIGNEARLARSMAGESEQRFSDVGSDHFASDAIDELAEDGVVEGYSDGSFGASNAVNQAECLKVLLGAFGRKVADQGGEWYEPYVDYGDDLGITVGNADPAHVMTRGEVAHQIAVLAGLSLLGVPSCPFSDLDESHPYYYEILAAHDAGVLRGDGSATTVRPDDQVTRAELAVLAVRGRNAQPSLETATVSEAAALHAVQDKLGWGGWLLVKGLLGERDTIPEDGPYPSIWIGASAGAVIGAEFLRGVTVMRDRIVVWTMAGFMGGLYLTAEGGLTFANGPLPEEGWSSNLTLGADGKVFGLDVGGEVTWEQDPDGPESVSVSGGIEIPQTPIGIEGTTGETDEGTIGVGGSAGLTEHIVYTKYNYDLALDPA